MLSDSDKEEVRRIFREEFQEQAAGREIEFAEDFSNQDQGLGVWKCIGKVKDYLVWGAVTGFKCVCVCMTITGTYSFFQLVTEIRSPGSLPDLNEIAHSIHEKYYQPELSNPPVIKAARSPRYLAYSDKWLDLGTDQEIRDAADTLLVDEDNLYHLTLIPEGSGIIDKSFFDRSYEVSLAGTGSNNESPYEDDFPDQPMPQGPQTTTTAGPQAPPYPGSVGLNDDSEGLGYA